MKIDTSFNFQAAMNNPNRDADKYSRVLQDYHQALWGKQLPNGDVFQLEKLQRDCLLYYTRNDMTLSSDRAVPTFSRWKKMQRVISNIPHEELDEFRNLTETIGAITIWPSTRVGGMNTINGERGLNCKVYDRLDITIECIRRYYNDESSPLHATFKRYKSFFDLFVDFRGYVDFFLFQDYVSADYSSVKIAVPFDDFVSTPSPKTKEEYIQYMHHMSELIILRNNHIEQYAQTM